MKTSPWKNFTYAELACKCGHCNASSGERISTDLMDQVQALRDVCRFPLEISSAYRCSQHPAERNKTTPGTHNQGLAVDILCTGTQAYTVLKQALKLNVFTGIGVSQKGDHHRRFIHLDVSGGSHRPWIWSY